MLGTFRTQTLLDSRSRRLHWRVTITYQIWYPSLSIPIPILECKSMTVTVHHELIGLITPEPIAICQNLNHWTLSKASKDYWIPRQMTSVCLLTLANSQMFPPLGIFIGQIAPHTEEAWNLMTPCLEATGLSIGEPTLGLIVTWNYPVSGMDITV